MRVASIITGRDLQLLQLLLGEGGPVPSSATLKRQCHESCVNYCRRRYSWVKVVRCRLLQHKKTVS